MFDGSISEKFSEVNKTSLNDIQKIMSTEEKNKIDELKNFWNDLRGDEFSIDNEKVRGCPIEGNGGHWDGERGNSNWHPNKDEIPTGQHTNSDEKTWSEILSKYDKDSISFKDGEPDFTDFSKATVEIDNMSEKRTGKGGNFDQADRKLMEQTGMNKEQLDEFKQNHSWHESKDGKTMVLVDSSVHGNVSHEGGVAKCKEENNGG